MIGTIEIKPLESHDYGPCDCCGNISRTIWGDVYADGCLCAAYFIHWTVDHVLEHGAHFDFIVGKWGEGSTKERRFLIALEYRIVDSGPEFMVIDAATRPRYFDELAAHRLSRTDVIGDPLAKDVFAICDAIWLQDPRVAPLRAFSGEVETGSP